MAVIFLDPQLQAARQIETKQDRKVVKRPRVGSLTTHKVQLPSGFGSQVTLLIDKDPDEITTDEMGQELSQARLVACSSSEFGAETDVQRPIMLGPLLPWPADVGNSDSAFLPFMLPSTPKAPFLSPVVGHSSKNCSRMLRFSISTKGIRLLLLPRTRLPVSSRSLPLRPSKLLATQWKNSSRKLVN